MLNLKIPNFDEPDAFESFLFGFFGGPIVDFRKWSTFDYTEVLNQHENSILNKKNTKHVRLWHHKSEQWIDRTEMISKQLAISWHNLKSISRTINYIV